MPRASSSKKIRRSPSAPAKKTEPAPLILSEEDSTATEILGRLRAALGPVQLSLRNLSEAHRKHKEAKKQGGGHYALKLVSEAFTGLNLKERQQWVMGLLSDLFGNKLHALQLDLKEPSEVPLRVEQPGRLVAPPKKSLRSKAPATAASAKPKAKRSSKKRRSSL